MSMSARQEWVTNTSGSLASGEIARLAVDNPGSVYIVGKPKATDNYTVPELEFRGMVGIYRVVAE